MSGFCCLPFKKQGKTGVDERAPRPVEELKDPPQRVAARPANPATVKPIDKLLDQSRHEVVKNPPSTETSQSTSVAPPSQSGTPDSASPDIPPSGSQGCDSGSHHASEKSLWQQAHDRLAQEDELLPKFEAYVLEHARASADVEARNVGEDEVQLGQIQVWARQELDNLSQRRLVISAGNRKFVVRDKIHQIVNFISKYKGIVSAGISAEPTAALAWGGAMAIFPFLQNVFQQDEDAAAGFEEICYFLAQINVLEHHMNARLKKDGQPKPNDKLSSLIAEKIVVLYTNALRYQIRLLVHYSHHSLFRVFRDAAQIDDWKAMSTGVKEVVEKIHAGFQTLTNDTILSIVPAVLDEVTAFHEEFTVSFLSEPAGTGIFTRVPADFEQDREHEKRLNELNYVGAALYDSRGVEEHGGCQYGTQRQTLKTIQEWAQDPNGPFIFWLHGLAGTGKTSIALTVAQSLHERTPFAGHETSGPLHSSVELGASYFFSHHDKNRSSASNFFVTLAWSLGRGVSALKEHISKAIQDNPNVNGMSLEGQFHSVIFNPLSALDKESLLGIRFVIVLDALDECSDVAKTRKLLQLMQELTRLKKVQIRVLVTSRREEYISRSFDKFSQGSYHSLSLEKIQSHTSAGDEVDDITKYLETRLSQIAIDQDWPEDWLNDDKIQRMTKIAGGLFLCASVTCRFLDFHLDTADLDDRLQHIQEGSNDYRRLDGHPSHVYMTVLQYHHVGRNSQRTEGEKKKACDEIKAILGTMALLLKPATMATLGLFTSYGRKELECKVVAFGSVVNIPKKGNLEHGLLSLVHLSLSEYLLSEQCPPDFRVDSNEKHCAILEMCILFMTDALHQDMADIQHPGGLVQDIEPGVVDSSIPQHVQYSCRYWIDHLESLSEDTRSRFLVDGGLIDKFLRTKFLFWVEALSLMGRMNESILAMNRFHSMVANSSSDCHDLGAFVQDARPFLRTSRPAIDKAPLQLYSSALVFSPERSILRTLFSKQSPPWIKSITPRQTDWDPELFLLEHEDDGVMWFAFSPDGTTLASLDGWNTIRLWDVETGIEMRRIVASSPQDEVSCSCLSLSGDGKLVVFGASHGVVGFWDTTSNELKTVKGPDADDSNPVWRVAFSPRGDRMASIARNGEVRLWLTTDGSEMCTLDHPSCFGQELRFSADGAVLVVGLNTGSEARPHATIRLWNVDTNENREVDAGPGLIKDMTLSSDGELTARATTKSIKFRDADASWTVSPRLAPSMMTWCALSPGDAKYTALTKAGSVRVYLTATGEEVGHCDAPDKGRISFSPDGRYLASSSKVGIRLWDVSLLVRPGPLALGHGGKQLVRAPGRVRFFPGVDNVLAIRDTNSGIANILDWTVEGELSPRTMPFVQALQHSPDGRSLAAFVGDDVEFWDPALDEEHLTLKRFPEVDRVTFSKYGEFVALETETQVSILRTATWEELAVFPGASGPVFSPANSLVAWHTAHDQLAHLWDLSKERSLFQGAQLYVGEEEPPFWFSPNGLLFAYLSCSPTESYTVHVLEVATEQELCAFDVRLAPLELIWNLRLSFSANSELIVVSPCLGPEERGIFALVRSTRDGSEIKSLELEPSKSSFLDMQCSPTGIFVFVTLSQTDKPPSRLQQLNFQLWNSNSDEGIRLLKFTIRSDELRTCGFSDDGSLLKANIGKFPLPRLLQDPSAAIPGRDAMAWEREIPRDCVFFHYSWISWGFDHILWLPQRYRNLNHMVMESRGNRVVFRGSQGLVGIEFDLGKLSFKRRWMVLET